MVRFRCLIAVFRARRLTDLLMHTGYRLIAPAVQVAARMRLNAEPRLQPRQVRARAGRAAEPRSSRAGLAA